MGGARGPGPVGRYLTGLGVAGLGLCAAGWLVLTPFAFGYRGRGWRGAALTDWATGGGLAAACLITLAAWAIAWRRALLADGVLARSPRSRARVQRRRERHGSGASTAPDPGQVLTALRALLGPLLDPAAEPSAAPAGEPGTAGEPDAAGEPVAAVIPGPRSAPEEPRAGLAVIKSMLAGAELPMTGFEEEEVW